MKWQEIVKKVRAMLAHLSLMMMVMMILNLIHLIKVGRPLKKNVKAMSMKIYTKH
jgi:hypothetical protein